MACFRQWYSSREVDVIVIVVNLVVMLVGVGVLVGVLPIVVWCMYGVDDRAIGMHYGGPRLPCHHLESVVGLRRFDTAGAVVSDSV